MSGQIEAADTTLHESSKLKFRSKKLRVRAYWLGLEIFLAFLLLFGLGGVAALLQSKREIGWPLMILAFAIPAAISLGMTVFTMLLPRTLRISATRVELETPGLATQSIEFDGKTLRRHRFGDYEYVYLPPKFRFIAKHSSPVQDDLSTMHRPSVTDASV